MKKIIINLSIIGLLACSMQLPAMGQNTSPGVGILPVLASATTLGGLSTAAFFWNKNRKLKAPKKPEKPKDSGDLKETEENYFHLLTIQTIGKNFTKHQEHYENIRNEMLNRFRKLKFAFAFDSENSPYQTKEYLIKNLSYGLADQYIGQAFNADKEQRKVLKNVIFGRKLAVEFADFTDDHVEKHKQKKEALEKQKQEQQEQYQKDEVSYPQRINQYNSQVKLNRTFMALGAGVTGLGAALLYFGNKK
jgi:hypothetical protein